jgi:aminoglycoside phosphotransferase (APT) family kinase protein
VERRTAFVELSRAQIETALRAMVGQLDVVSYEPIAGGRANTNYVLTTTQDKLVLRLHVRKPECCAKERALHALLSDVVPLAPLLATCESRDVIGHAFSIWGFVEGGTLEQALHGGVATRLETAARSLGHALARLTQFRYERCGDLLGVSGSDSLRVAPWSTLEFFRHALFESPAAARLGSLRDRTWRLVQLHQHADDSWPIQLAHGDFGPTNLLVDSSGEVSAVLDWEFAHAGRIFADLGNLLRQRPEAPLPRYFVPALLEGLSDLGVALPTNWDALRLLHDLASACEFLSSAEARPHTHARAIEQIRTTLELLER